MIACNFFFFRGLRYTQTFKMQLIFRSSEKKKTYIFIIQVFLLLKIGPLNEWLFIVWVLGGGSVEKVLFLTNVRPSHFS